MTGVYAACSFILLPVPESPRAQPRDPSGAPKGAPPRVPRSSTRPLVRNQSFTHRGPVMILAQCVPRTASCRV
ncbi:hypothetical protein ASPTUDRAFT_46649 [Aspergillus tubingensis CBS 134.48]|uniref:Uncharacterized protein n=1 Tax=Aspergillus tubingensis (strain CBS 134.48) TaxID=767770 RepID=A0A1L9MW82_ASPTC|nr:hypothetical protein ASPTUDRAFT_46649 [Aspergillus tubingensis CBS 134.48]